MRVFKTRWFARFAKRQAIADADLRRAVERAERGLIDADLGGGVIKQRIARPNEGKSSGFRTIILFRSGARSFFVYGFPKSARDNVQKNELLAFRELADEMLRYDELALMKAIDAGALIEVKYDGKCDQDEDLR